MEELDCPICFLPMEEICILTSEPDADTGKFCNHCFCLSCTEDVIGRARGNNAVPLCPTCRREVRGWVRNTLAEDLALINKQHQARIEELQRLRAEGGDAEDNAHQQRIVRVDEASAHRMQEIQHEQDAVHSKVNESLEREHELQGEQQQRILQIEGACAARVASLQSDIEAERERARQLEARLHSEQQHVRGESLSRFEEIERLRKELVDVELRHKQLEAQAQAEREASQRAIAMELASLRHQIEAEQSRRKELEADRARLELAQQQQRDLNEQIKKRLEDERDASSRLLAQQKEHMQQQAALLERKAVDAERQVSDMSARLTLVQEQEQTLRRAEQEKAARLEGELVSLQQKMEDITVKYNEGALQLESKTDLIERTLCSIQHKEIELQRNETSSVSPSSYASTWTSMLLQSPKRLTDLFSARVPPKLAISLDDFVIKERRGSSRFSSVLRARHVREHREFALKKKTCTVEETANKPPSVAVGTVSSSALLELYREAAMLFFFRSAHIVKMRGLSPACLQLPAKNTANPPGGRSPDVPAPVSEDDAAEPHRTQPAPAAGFLATYGSAVMQSRGVKQMVSRMTSLMNGPVQSLYLAMPFWEFDLEFVLGNAHSTHATCAALPRPLTPPIIARLMHQVLKGLAHMHASAVVHRNLIPSSILVDADMNACIASMASARSVFSQPFSLPPAEGATSWAPELWAAVLKNPNTDTLALPADEWKAMDMWSVGCILVQMLTGQPLAGGLPPSQLCTTPSALVQFGTQLLGRLHTFHELTPPKHSPVAAVLPTPPSPTRTLADLVPATTPPDLTALLFGLLSPDAGKARWTVLRALASPVFVGCAYEFVEPASGRAGEDAFRVDSSLLTDANVPRFVADNVLA